MRYDSRASSYIFAAVLAGVAAQLVDYHFFPATDGIQATLVPNRYSPETNYFAVERSLRDGSWVSFAAHPISSLHLCRFFLSWPFVQIEALCGSAAPILLLSLVAFPLAVAWDKNPGILSRLLASALPFIFLGIGGRTSLVAIGMGYAVLAAIEPERRGKHLAIAAPLSLFSAASLVLTIGVLSYGAVRQRVLKGGRLLAVGVLALFLAASASHKVPGFIEGGPGYETSGGTSAPCTGATCVIERAVSRSTLLFSLTNDQTLRFAFYFLMLLTALSFLALDYLRSTLHPLSIPIAICLLGFLGEGLGVWTLLIPLMWRSMELVSNSATAFQGKQRLEPGRSQ